jgi:hypothetical protein
MLRVSRSFYRNVSAGAAIVLVCTRLFIVALIAGARDGILARYRHEHQSRRL